MQYQRIAMQAAAHQRAGDLRSAERLLRQAAAMAPADREVCTALGTVLYQERRLDEAERWMRQAVELDPGFVQGHNNLGYVLLREGRTDEAIQCFSTALGIDPRNAEAHANLGDAWQSLGRSAEAIASYRHCLERNPARAQTWNNLGNVLNAQGRRDEARHCYERALAAQPGYTIARANLDALDAGTVPAWHFQMLADAPRNQAYQAAIERAIGPESRVLDIGTGSGLLAMLAARAGAQSVLACEANPAAAAAAEQVIAANGLAQRIQVIAKRSADLERGRDLQLPVNAIVHEILDSKLVGEGVLPSLRHALQHLADPDPVVIPRAATIHAALAALPDLRRGFPLRDVCGFDLSAFDRLRDPSHVVQIDLDHVAHQRLTPVADVLRLSFTAPPPSAPDSSPHRRDFELRACKDGVAHAVVFWFTLELDDKLRLSTGPGRDSEAASIHWRQVAWFLPQDLPVRRGEPVRLQLHYSDWRLGFSLARESVVNR